MLIVHDERLGNVKGSCLRLLSTTMERISSVDGTDLFKTDCVIRK